MKSRTRLSLLILAGCLCAAWSNSLQADEFGTVDGQGADPLLDAYPFFIFPNSTKIAQIVFEVDNWSNTSKLATLDVQCCTDWALGTSVRPAGVTFEAVSDIEGPGPSAPSGAQHGPPVQLGQQRLPPNQFLPTPRVARMVGLKVTTGANPKPGRYVATVKVSALGGYSRSTRVIVSVLPPLMESTTPSCAAFTTSVGTSDVAWGPSPAGASLIPTDPLVPLVKSQFDARAANFAQARTSLPYGWYAAPPTPSTEGTVDTTGGRPAGVLFTILKSNLPLSPTQAFIGFLNSTSDDKEFVAFNSALCAPVATILLKSGESTTLLAGPMTTTILLRRTAPGMGWGQVSVLSEPQLWTLLGGRAVTFEWFRGPNDR
jgi:hypothetical protein